MLNIERNLNLRWVSALGIFICAGCSTYQYAVLDGDLNRDQSYQFIHETDSIRVKYSFMGENGPIQIEIFNKQTQPVYVDWKKSSLIINENTIPYWKDESIINATSAGYNLNWMPTYTTNRSQTDGIISRAVSINFIPPQSSVTHNSIFIKQEFFQLPQPSSDNEMKLNPNGATALKYTYQPENSPLKFRSYLTLSSKEDFSKTMVLDNHFWVTEIMQSSIEPSLFPGKINQFYIKETTGAGLAAAGILTVVLVASATAQPQDK